MNERSITAGDIMRVLAGDAASMVALEGRPHFELVAAVECLPSERLTVSTAAVRRVLEGLLNRSISDTQAQSWASFVRRGFIPYSQTGSIRPVEITYQETCEDGIAQAISRMDELGDPVDGTIDDSELGEMIQRLRD